METILGSEDGKRLVHVKGNSTGRWEVGNGKIRLGNDEQSNFAGPQGQGVKKCTGLWLPW